jgi:RHS repeat-associated protein
LITFVDRRGQTSQFSYDALNRLIGEKYIDAIVSRGYDQQGHLVHVEDSQGGTFDLSYDPAGRLLGSSNQIGTISYTYDGAGQTLTRQVAGLDALQYTYDVVGNMTSAALPQASASFVYDARNQVQTISRANGVTSKHQYDAAGRLLSLVHSGPSGVINAQGYTYDAVGNRTSYVTNLGRPLITQAVSSTVDAGNRLITTNNASFTYDANGNFASIEDSIGTTANVWDSRGRLQSISGPATQAVFHYDFARNLISQSVNGIARSFILDDLTDVVAIVQSSDVEQVLSGRSTDEHLAVIHTTEQIEYGLIDAVNSTVALVDQGGKQTSSFFYEPFGKTSPTQTAYPFQFTGRVPALASVYYYRARFYDPETGRFDSEDPLGIALAGQNLFSYVSNNPISHVDPLGLIDRFQICKFLCEQMLKRLFKPIPSVLQKISGLDGVCSQLCQNPYPPITRLPNKCSIRAHVNPNQPEFQVVISGTTVSGPYYLYY